MKRVIYTGSVTAASPLKEDGTGYEDFMDETCWTPLDLSFAHCEDYDKVWLLLAILSLAILMLILCWPNFVAFMVSMYLVSHVSEDALGERTVKLPLQRRERRIRSGKPNLWPGWRRYNSSLGTIEVSSHYVATCRRRDELWQLKFLQALLGSV